MKQFTFYITVLIDLIELGTLQSDIQSKASTWKHISKLANDYYSVHHALKQQQQQRQHQPTNAISERSLDWLAICIKNICKSIEENIQTCLETVMNHIFFSTT